MSGFSRAAAIGFGAEKLFGWNSSSPDKQLHICLRVHLTCTFNCTAFYLPSFRVLAFRCKDMFRYLVPRAAPRSISLPSKTFASTSFAPPRFYILHRSRRGYATEAGELPSPNLQVPSDHQKKSMISSSLVAAWADTSVP